MQGGCQCENLEQLTFENESFDLFITQDVFEHVMDAAAGFREIARVLKWGGAHIFTIPLYPRECSIIRARKERDRVVHIKPPEYHGNPVDPNGALVVTEWGRDIAEFIKQASGLNTQVFSVKNREYGLAGEFLDVLVSRKR